MTSTVCYFFFKDGEEKRSNCSDAISAILHQLLARKSDTPLLTHALSSYKNYGEKLRDEFSEMWDILIKSAKDPDAGEIVCVLDALDECKENSRKALIDKLVGFFSKTEQLKNLPSALKFLVISRPYEDLELGFQQISILGSYTHFDADEQSESIAKEIDLVIDAKVPQIAGDFSAEDRNSISDRLKRPDNRTYLWLFLTLDIIKSSRSKYGKISSIDELLSSLPSSVSEAYEKILSRSSDKNAARILLQIVVAARRPLTLEEANIALSIATRRGAYKSDKSLELGLWPSTSFKSIVRNLCGLLISVFDSKIFLIHQTARESLISSSKSDTTALREWEGSLNMTMTHGTISQICLEYLNFQEFGVPRNQLYQDNVPRIMEDRIIEDRYPFFNYAANEWPLHYTSQNSELARNSRMAAGMLCRTSLPQVSYWFPEWSGTWSELEIASQLGLLYVVEDFLNEVTDINAVNCRSNRHGTALTIASAGGHEKVVEMLLNKDVDVNGECQLWGTALIAAVIHGNDQITELLLNRNANVNAEVQSEYSRDSTALKKAVARNNDHITEMLLNRNANVNADNPYTGTALMAAARGGQEEAVEMLLNRSADINAENEYEGTALIGAAREGHRKIVEMLLNRSVEINAENEYEGTALIGAARKGDRKIVEMLLNHNADANAINGRYGTALIAASSGGYEKIVEMLFNRNADVNADVNAKIEYHDTALIAASPGGYEKIVKMLLDRNADVNAKIEHNDTALIVASSRGHELVVQLLLDKGVDVNASGRRGNALQVASHQGRGRVVETLLDRNDIAGKDGALERACDRHRITIVENLLRRDPEVDFAGEIYRNLLAKASYYHSTVLVEMLLNKMIERNVEVEAYANSLEAALEAAAAGERKRRESAHFYRVNWPDNYYYALVEMLMERKREFAEKGS